MIRFSCPNCSATYSAAEEHAGQRTTCKQCQTKFLIPGGVEPPYEIEPPHAPSQPAPVPEPEPSFLAPPPPEPPAPELAVPVELEPCPKCQAKMSVRPEDVGFDLQCPFCQTVFRGVAASATPPPVPASELPARPPAAETPGVEIAPCPKCRAELTVDPADVGGEVECPFCQTIYKAEKPKPKANTLLARPSTRPAPPAPPPPKVQSLEDDGDTTPIKMKKEKFPDPDEDDDDDYRPRKRKKRRRSSGDPYEPYEERPMSLEPSDGVVCLLLGFASFCCFFLAIWAIYHCRETISKVDSGVMEPSAKPFAQAGMVLAYIAVALTLLSVMCRCFLAFSGNR